MIHRLGIIANESLPLKHHWPYFVIFKCTTITKKKLKPAHVFCVWSQLIEALDLGSP